MKVQAVVVMFSLLQHHDIEPRRAHGHGAGQPRRAGTHYDRVGISQNTSAES
jgi:hypothetical protein